MATVAEQFALLVQELESDDTGLYDRPLTRKDLFDLANQLATLKAAIGLQATIQGGAGGGMTSTQATALLARVGTNNAVADPAGSQSAQMRAIAEALIRPPWLASEPLVLTDSTVTPLPNIPAAATKAEIQFQYSDETVSRVARSTVNGTPPTQTLGWFEYNDSIIKIDTRAEVTAYRVRRLDGLGTLNARVAYYG